MGVFVAVTFGVLVDVGVLVKIGVLVKVGVFVVVGETVTVGVTVTVKVGVGDARTDIMERAITIQGSNTVSSGSSSKAFQSFKATVVCSKVSAACA